MRSYATAVLMGICVVGAVYGQGDAEWVEEEGWAVEYWLGLLLPLGVLFLLLWLFSRRASKINRPWQQRSVEHMERMEQKYDRIIELLEKMIERAK